MSRMTVSDRNQAERASYVDSSRPPRTKAGRRAAIAYTVIGALLLAVMTYAAFRVFDGGHHLIIIADIIIVFLGLAAWVNPERRNV
ncbi:MAG TPA: hypothetical protein VK919_05390 [Solirubrobacterales bacterium]|nr:hypothetical protein [Solirubrobacterales bacterium]